jgi:hypothetical protein
LWHDTFATNDIASYSTTGGPSITGGVLQGSGADDRVHLLASAAGAVCADSIAQCKVNFGASGSHDISLILRDSAGGGIWCNVNSGAAQFVVKDWATGGGATQATAFAYANSTSYWIRGRIHGTSVIAELWSIDPLTATATDVSHILATVYFTISNGGAANSVGRGTVGIRNNSNSGDSVDELYLWSCDF